MIDNQGHEYQNYPYRMYKAKPLASTESPPPLHIPRFGSV
jgi:hypothetical protein